MRVAVVGLGAVGARVARTLAGRDATLDLVDPDAARRRRVERAVGDEVVASSVGVFDAARGADVVVLASPAGTHVVPAELALAAGSHVVSVADAPDEVRELRGLAERASASGSHVVVGAGFSPGLTGLAVAHGGRALDAVEEIHVAVVGRGGPAAHRRRRDALTRPAVDLVDGTEVRRGPGSAREWTFFPDPIGGRSVVAAESVEPQLLATAHPGAGRITARVAASRRELVVSRLPQLRTAAEGGPGAMRVELRGRTRGAVSIQVFGALQYPAAAAASVAATMAVGVGHGAEWAGEPRVWSPVEVADPAPPLRELHTAGVTLAMLSNKS